MLSGIRQQLSILIQTKNAQAIKRRIPFDEVTPLEKTGKWLKDCVISQEPSGADSGILDGTSIGNTRLSNSSSSSSSDSNLTRCEGSCSDNSSSKNSILVSPSSSNTISSSPSSPPPLARSNSSSSESTGGSTCSNVVVELVDLARPRES